MSPKQADPGVRLALMEAGARLVARGGVEALTIRRLAAEVGVSTMAIYTHFGGMEELRSEMQKEAFERLNARVRSVKATADPVADLSAMGWMYCSNALAEPNFYRIMFMEDAIDDPDVIAAGVASFEPLVTTVERSVDAKRFRPGDAWNIATQMWAMCHGFVTLRLAGMMTDELVMQTLVAMAMNMFVGLGDEPSAAQHSLERAIRRMQRQAPLVVAASIPAGRDLHAEDMKTVRQNASPARA